MRPQHFVLFALLLCMHVHAFDVEKFIETERSAHSNLHLAQTVDSFFAIVKEKVQRSNTRVDEKLAWLETMREIFPAARRLAHDAALQATQIASKDIAAKICIGPHALWDDAFLSMPFCKERLIATKKQTRAGIAQLTWLEEDTSYERVCWRKTYNESFRSAHDVAKKLGSGMTSKDSSDTYSDLGRLTYLAAMTIVYENFTRDHSFVDDIWQSELKKQQDHDDIIMPVNNFINARLQYLCDDEIETWSSLFDLLLPITSLPEDHHFRRDYATWKDRLKAQRSTLRR